MFNFLRPFFIKETVVEVPKSETKGGVKIMEMKFKLVVTHEPVVEELEFETLEALQAKVAELTPPVSPAGVPTPGQE